jgi:uncharacterized small protein (DUF1192 family)
MTDLASLGIRVESQEVARADGHLDNLTASAVRAETATERLAAAARGQGAAQMVANTAIRQQAATLAAVRGGMGLTAAEGLNLSRQFTDIGVTAAMGMNPLLIAIQQGPQVLDTFQMAAARTGTTVTAAMNAAAAATWRAMAPFLPLIAAVGAATAAIGGTLAIATRELNKDFGDLTEGMGLTEKQLQNVQNRGVTMGDVVGGSLSYLRDIIWDKVGPSVTKLGEWFSETMDRVTSFVWQGIRNIAAGFGAARGGIIASWGMLPEALGDIAISAANHVIRAVVDMVNRGRTLLNAFILASNAVSPGADLPLIRAIEAPAFANRFAGAGRAAGGAFARGAAQGAQDGLAWLDRQRAALAGSITNAARNRIRGEAGDADAERRSGSPSRDGARETAHVVERLQQLERVNLQPLQGMFVDIYDTLEQTADELRLIDDLTRDMANGLSSAFGETGRALGDLLTTMTGYEERLASMALAEREHRLTAMQAERERSQAQIQSYGDMAAAARGFFREGSDGYRVMLAIEQVYRAQQLAGMLQSILFGRQEAASSVANSMAKGAASTAAGAAKMFEALGPWAFPAVAAMLGLLAGLGLKNGGGGAASLPSAANDNTSAEASTAAVRAFSARDAQSRDASAAAIAARVDVRVTADREGLNAYVESKAAEVATPIAANAALTGYAVQREERRQAVRRARQSFVR